MLTIWTSHLFGYFVLQNIEVSGQVLESSAGIHASYKVRG